MIVGLSYLDSIVLLLNIWCSLYFSLQEKRTELLLCLASDVGSGDASSRRKSFGNFSVVLFILHVTQCRFSFFLMVY